MNDFSPWDIANSFRLHEAACLIAGVMPLSKRVPDREELPAPAIPIYVKMGSTYVLNWVSYHKGLPADPKYPALKGCDEIPTLPELEPLKKLTGEFVTREELHRWVKAMGIKSAYSFAPIVASPSAEPDTAPAQTPAPVVAAGEATPDPERRLALLRALGGTAKYKNCEWTFTGIGALVEREQADCRKRSTEKTIRADLKEAAQNERDANRAGFATSLGQR